jgi:hypothetical protein
MTENEKKLCKIEKLIDNQWVIVRMSEIKKGDIFKHEEFKETFRAIKDSYLNPNNIWSVDGDNIEDLTNNLI